MIDLHTHTYFSDGILGPSELVYRAKIAGYTVIGLTDHADFSNIGFIIQSIRKVSYILEKEYNIIVIPGIELTYVPPRLIQRGVRMARRLGAEIILVHGESPVEPVPPGTNHAAIMSGIDILAHPGFITKDDSILAKKRRVLLEITSRQGHSIGNTHGAHMAKQTGASLIFNTDTHMPEDIITQKGINKILRLAKLNNDDFSIMQNNAIQLIKKKHRLKRNK